ncbi:tudor domain-containing protein 15 [Embiotoca jacksoni]|uniref:tudor domain-containing protein 15 n=1 Tax=Embiotoca jacksoni TaxID=100190 RepID=UPI003703959D
MAEFPSSVWDVTAPDSAAMQSVLQQKPQDRGPPAPQVVLRITHLDWTPEATLIHFQGQYRTAHELDYNILHGEMQNAPKTRAAVDIGEFCLVEDATSARWYRGRVQSRTEDSFEVFLVDHGNILSVDVARISSCSDDLLILPPKVVSGFLANVLLLRSCPRSAVREYLSSLIGGNVAGCIQSLLPHRVLLLEAPDVNADLVGHAFGRHVDGDTFLLLVQMLTNVPLEQNAEPVPDLLADILSIRGPRLNRGTRDKVRVTAAVHPRLFYCQPVVMETELSEMSRKLAAACEGGRGERDEKTPENLGLLCSAKGKDGRWRRGSVRFLPVDSRVRVLFVDYGFSESVGVENVRRLPPGFESAPAAAFRCSLASLAEPDEALRAQQLSFFKAGLLGDALDVEISGYDEERRLYSVAVFGAEDNRVREPEPEEKLPSTKAEYVFEAEELSPRSGHLNYERIAGETLRRTLEAERLRVDSVFVGYVTHAQNPNHFWIRTQKRDGDFEKMMTKMEDHFGHVKLGEDALSDPEPGTLCCPLYEEDMHFYRGVVVDTLKHGAEVLFIDFGNIEKVPHMLVKKIPETFAGTSAFAFPCTLANVFPLDEVWTGAPSDFFRKAVLNKAWRVHVLQMRKNKFVVDLFEMGSDSRSIADLLVSSKQAEYIPVVQNRARVTEKTRHRRVGVATDGGGGAEKRTDRGQGKNKNPNEKAQPQPSFKALRIKPGCEIAVRCSYVNSATDFWCQPRDTVPALEELMCKIQQHYSAHALPLRSGDSCCVAESPRDGRWYRAVVTQRRRGRAEVVLVDYGRAVRVGERHLRAITPEFLSLEGQAFRCSLHGVIEPADGGSPEVCNFLKDFVVTAAGRLRCKVVSRLNVRNKGFYNVVELYDRRSVGDALAELGLTTASTETFVYSSFDLRPGDEEDVYVAHVGGRGELYCHLDRNADIYEELERKISEESEKMTRADPRAAMSTLCLAKYSDGKFYRGVARPVRSPLHLAVSFVDFGNTAVTEKSSVAFIRRDAEVLLRTPVQAAKCHLDSVPKEELRGDAEEWLDAAVLNKRARAVVRRKNEDGSFDVELFDGEVDVNEKVKELARRPPDEPKTAVGSDKSSTKTKRASEDERSSFERDRRVHSNIFGDSSIASSRTNDVVFAERAKATRNTKYERGSFVKTEIADDGNSGKEKIDSASKMSSSSPSKMSSSPSRLPSSSPSRVSSSSPSRVSSSSPSKMSSSPSKMSSSPSRLPSSSPSRVSSSPSDASTSNDAVTKKPLTVDFSCQYGTNSDVEREVGILVTEKDEKPPASSSETDVTRCRFEDEARDDEISESERKTPTSDGRNLMPETASVPTEQDSRVVVWRRREDKCDVFLADRGITEETPSGSIGQRRGDVTEIPDLAVLCKIKSLESRERVSRTRWRVDVPADGVHVAKETVDAGQGESRRRHAGTQVPGAEFL